MLGLVSLLRVATDCLTPMFLSTPLLTTCIQDRGRLLASLVEATSRITPTMMHILYTNISISTAFLLLQQKVSKSLINVGIPGRRPRHLNNKYKPRTLKMQHSNLTCELMCTYSQKRKKKNQLCTLVQNTL